MTPIQDDLVLTIFAASVAVGLLYARPERRPRYLAPWHLLAATGAANLLLVQLGLAIFAFSYALGITSAKVSAGALWSGVALLLLSTVTVLRFVWSFRALGKEMPLTSEELPQKIKDRLLEVGGCLRGTYSHNSSTIRGSWVQGDGHPVEVRMRGRLITIGFRHGFRRWLRDSARAAEPVLRAFHRFILFHEVGHSLNGDHSTARLRFAITDGYLASAVVSLLLGAMGAAGALLGPPSFAWQGLLSASIIGLLLVILFTLEWLAFRSFFRERERLADYRAFRSLSETDQSLLMTKRFEHKTMLLHLMDNFATAARDPAARPVGKLRQWFNRIRCPTESCALRAAALDRRLAEETRPYVFGGIRTRMTLGAILGVHLGLLFLCFGGLARAFLDALAIEPTSFGLLLLIASQTGAASLLAQWRPRVAKMLSNSIEPAGFVHAWPEGGGRKAHIERHSPRHPSAYWRCDDPCLQSFPLIPICLRTHGTSPRSARHVTATRSEQS